MTKQPPLEPHEQSLWRSGYEAGWDNAQFADPVRVPAWINAIALGLIFGLGILIGKYLQ